MVDRDGRGDDGFLAGIRVLELSDELGEYCGKVLAGLGAEVVKVEPTAGESTRQYGPHNGDRSDLNGSLYFWHYGFGKKSVTIDLDDDDGRDTFRRLAASADVILESRPPGYMAERGLSFRHLQALNAGIVLCRVSPFGDDGPWAHYKGSDLVHLALGGVVMNCGYDPDPTGTYDTPPIAPQMWHAYHITGEMAAMAVVAALYYREQSGRGQELVVTVHDAVAKQTELDAPNWVYARQVHGRATCRHSMPQPNTAQTIAATKDGRWILPYRTYLSADPTEFDRTVALLAKYGMADDLTEERYLDPGYRAKPEVNRHIDDVVRRFVAQFLFNREIWREAQAANLTWAAERRPEENLPDPHWAARDTFVEVEHPEVGRTFTEVGAKWTCRDVPWRRGPRAPLLGEHNAEIVSSLEMAEPGVVPPSAVPTERTPSNSGRPGALAGVRFIDLTWLLASGGAGRYLSSLGAEVIKIEHRSHWDPARRGGGVPPPGGRAERDAANGPLPSERPDPAVTPNRSGYFMEINAGKRAISLNLKHPRGKALLTRLLQTADVVAEGYSPGTMERMGFGYERLQEINPGIVYVQQSGMGETGLYGRMRSYGPVAQALSGLSEMSGLEEPYPPAGIGYSYLDWFGAYQMALAIMAGIYRRRRTGRGCWIDSSQTECGIYLTGTAILDYTANGRRWQRYGNRSPYKAAAPHGVYRTAGDDRWIAIACFSDADWQALAGVLGHPSWSRNRDFMTLEQRLAHQDELDSLLSAATARWDRYELMHELQRAGVAAGVCQTAEDRYDHDPQLRHLGWTVELQQTELGTWPVKEFPVRFSETPAFMGGLVNRHGPNYGEDNEYVYGELLGLSKGEIRELEEADVI